MLRKSSIGFTFALASATAVVVSSAALHAAHISYSTGFEAAQGYVVPTAIPSVGSYNGWYRLDGTATTSGTPLMKIAGPALGNGSAQSLHFKNQLPQNQNDPGSVTYGISPVANQPGANNVVLNNTPFVTVKWDMRVVDMPAITDTSDLWSLDVYDGGGVRRTASVARSAIPDGSGNTVTSFLYTTDGSLPVDSNGNAPYNPTDVGVGPASGDWATYELLLNYVNHTYTFKLNGTQMGPARAMNPLSNNGIDINFAVNGRGLDEAYFDNFSVSAVPEPTSAALLALAFTGLLSHRRQAGRSRPGLRD